MSEPHAQSRAQAAADALSDAGVRAFGFVPGYGGTEVFEALQALRRRRGEAPLSLSLHEEVAYGLCHGAKLGGVRAACLLKAHGLAKAGNAVVSSLSAGVNAGLVVLVFDDEDGQHSDNIIRGSALAQGMELPWQHVGGGACLYDHIRTALAVSERRGLPYALVVPSRTVGGADGGQRRAAGAWAAPSGALEVMAQGERPTPSISPLARDPQRHVVCPPMSGYQRRVFDAKRASRDPDAIARPPLLQVPEGLPPRLRALAERYVPFFEVFRTLRGPVVSGDAGTSSLFAFAPYGCVDLCTYMGGSVPLALGAACAGHQPAWALTGDFSFVSAGHLGLLEATLRAMPLKVVIFDDGAASATGGQPLPPHLLDAALAAYQGCVIEVRDPADAAEVRAALLEAARHDALRIVRLRYRAP